MPGAFIEAVVTIYICGQSNGGRYQLVANYGKFKGGFGEEIERELSLDLVDPTKKVITKSLWSEKTSYFGPLALSQRDAEITVWKRSEGEWVPWATASDFTYRKGTSGIETDGDYGLTTGHPHVTRFWGAGETSGISTVKAGAPIPGAVPS
jgi:hypothetical protein